MSHFAPIAIIGMACRFPKAPNIRAFWDLLSSGGNTIEEMSEKRWNFDLFYDPDPATPNKCYQKHGSFLDKIHDFDPLLFNISPAEAIEMSPSQKLMLELTWEAIEDNNLSYDEIVGKKVGFYLGNVWNDFEHLRKHLNANTTLHSAIGQSTSVIANRVSYTFGFTGPSLVVDTGCSSSLVALHLACQSIWEGSSDMSFVGGINHILDHDQYILLSKFGGLSKKGQCSTFSDDVDGFVRGEGAGIILLKRLEDAQRDGDNIIGLVKGSSINNNGFNVNLPATSTKGQIEMLEEAYKHSGIAPSDVHYVEAHGTGTKLGDPTETTAIGRFFANGRQEERPLKIGSVKTNIGHMEAAAGIAGLLKVLLAMQHGKIPSNLNFRAPNPDIPFKELKLEINNSNSEWGTLEGESKKAGVNSFGWGGTNAHAVIEEYIPAEVKEETEPVLATDAFLLCLSAKSESALKAYAKNYAEHIGNASSLEEVAALCAATIINKPKLNYRISIAGNSQEELQENLRIFYEEGEEVPLAKLSGEAKVVFIFPGQGSQWVGMGKELYQSEPVFKAMIDACDAAFAKYTDWSLIEQLHAEKEASRLKEIDIIQPSLFAIEIALAKLWMSKGIMPDAVVGHSMGEVASAFIAGAIDLNDAANIICSRSKLMKTVSNTGGAMGVTELTVAQAEATIEKYNGKLSVAVSNSPKSTVIAGDETSLLEVLAELEAKDLFCRQVKVDVASHSPQMDPLMGPLETQLAELKAVKNPITYYSTVLNQVVPGEELTKEYWVKNLRGMVRFSEVIGTLLEENHTVFIEMSPHPVLTNAINECAQGRQKEVVTVGSTLRDKPEKRSFNGFVGKLFEQGYAINWKEFYQIEKAPAMQLPTYPMQKKRYALEDRSAQKNGEMGKNPLLGRRIQLAGIDDIFIWENKLSLEHLSFVKDHVVNNATVLPGVSYLEILYAALQEAFGNAFHQVEDLHFKRPIYLYDNETIDTQLKITRTGANRAVFNYNVKTVSGGNIKWVTTAEGNLRICGSREYVSDDYIYNLVRSKDDTFIKKEDFYKVTNSIGIQYGSIFQGINWILINNTQAIAHVTPNSLIAGHDNKYFIHPAILDSCFQTIFTPILAPDVKNTKYSTFLSQLKGFRWFNKPEPGNDILVKAETIDTIIEPNGITKQQVALQLYDESGNFLADIEFIEAVIIDNDQLYSNKETDWLYHTNWEKVHIQARKQEALVEEESIELQEGKLEKTWLIFEDHLGVEKKLIRLFKERGHRLIKVGFGDEFTKIDENHFQVNYLEKERIKELFSHLHDNHIYCEGIIHAASLNDHINYENLLVEDLDYFQNAGSILLINLHQVMSGRYQDAMQDAFPNLVVLSNGLLPVANKSTQLNITLAPMWGLAKVLFNEEPAYHCTRVDLSYFPDDREVAKLYDVIFAESKDEPELVIREEAIYASRLERENLPVFNLETVEFQDDKTFVVTGCGTAIHTMINWIIQKGIHNIALINDCIDAKEKHQAFIDEHSGKGINLKMFKADITDIIQLNKAINQVQEEMPPIKGIIHAAGLMETALISELDTKAFRKMLAPKMMGTWNLHTISLNLPLKHFIVFSSANSLIGLNGHGSAVAANTFVDFFAHFRVKQGLPCVAINWGAIEDATTEDETPSTEVSIVNEGFIPFKMEKGLDILDKLYTLAPAQLSIALMDVQKTIEHYDTLAETNYFSKLISAQATYHSDEELLRTALETGEKEATIALIAQIVTKKVAAITKASLDLISNSSTFKGLGIDSLMAIKLRNQLEQTMGIKMAVNNFWKYASIGQFSAFTYEAILKEEAGSNSDQSPWWVSHQEKDAGFYLYCFHDAGASSTLYDTWEELHPAVELRAIELPGRGSRTGEQMFTDMTELVSKLAEEIYQHNNSKPFVFFGHSMGGAIAFEIAKVFRRKQQPLPEMIFTSSTPALFSYDRNDLTNRMTDEELIGRFPHLSKESIPDEELRQSLVNIMRADLKLLDSFKYEHETPFEFPIISLRGKDDPGVSLEQVARWKEETTLPHTVIERKGGHRYLVDDSEFVSNLVKDKLKQIITLQPQTVS
ncbi:type I polyketide synthase [Chondrinema litorale]|uniref:type I polyketide synthase n=1 Tax=Chondrinema litorale TaxID=2994555 RepID=UPI0025427C08|nr:type I polyketide synthase [Chondrinema litorale]UZR98135.1 SDR family NAD(P)-dependent oxidoreductase [Chondrinema litorale]